MSDDRKRDAVPSQSVGRGRPRDIEKNAAIVEAAGDLFLEKGFDGTSMDEVAKRASVSKQTVYSHFSGKEQLFTAAIQSVIEEYNPDAAVSRVATHSLEADLRAVCETYAHLLMDKSAMGMFRILVAGANTNKGPALAQLFWDAGPRAMHEKLESFLQGWVGKGDLVIPDISLACSQIIELLKGKVHFIHSIGLLPEITEEHIQQNVDNTVAAFLKLYRV